MRVPIIQLGLDDETVQQVASVLKAGAWAEGRNVHALEEDFASYTGAKHARAVNNGTAAMICALHASGIRPGDEVIVPSFTFIATANAVLSLGARPVFADVDEATFNLDVEDVQRRITSATRAIMPVHLYGLPVDMDPLLELAAAKDVRVVEDACQAHGAAYKGKKCGALGNVAGFSLYPTKNMVCGGEGGLVTTSDDAIFAALKLYSNHGQAAKYMHATIGFNYRMQETNGVVARASLRQLDVNNEKRRANAAFYNEAFAGLDDVVTPVEPAGYTHVYHQYTLKVPRRDALAEHLQRHEIGFGIHYGVPVHVQASMKGVQATALPVTERLAKEVISLPVHPLLSREQLEFVAGRVKEFYA